MKIPQSITLFHGIMKFNIIAFFKALENNFVNSYFGLTRSWKLGISLMRDPSYKNVWQWTKYGMGLRARSGTQTGPRFILPLTLEKKIWWSCSWRSLEPLSMSSRALGPGQGPLFTLPSRETNQRQCLASCLMAQMFSFQVLTLPKYPMTLPSIMQKCLWRMVKTWRPLSKSSLKIAVKVINCNTLTSKVW